MGLSGCIIVTAAFPFLLLYTPFLRCWFEEERRENKRTELEDG